MKILQILMFLALKSIASSASSLAPYKYEPLPVGSVQPEGWLLKQLDIQAEGLSGYLAKHWPDIAQSVWIGGFADQGLHERAPYWLNGAVPLAFLLNNSDSTSISGKRIMEQMETYIDHILQHKSSKTGLLGPELNLRSVDPFWGPCMALLALTQYAEAVKGIRPNEFERTKEALRSHLLSLHELIQTTKLRRWAAARWQDIALSVAWLLDQTQGRDSKTSALLALMHMLHNQGLKWEIFLPKINLALNNTHNIMYVHNVNIAQALKVPAVLYRINKNISLRDTALEAMKTLDKNYGLPTGMFNGDEHLPDPATRYPSRGIELCGVVEAIFSYSILYATFGDSVFLDRAERIAFNALPATWASPVGGDMWAHQYLQAVNQIYAIRDIHHVWQTDGPMSMIYGLEPNYGCCTANFIQGWPKFAKNPVFMVNSSTIIVASYIPAMIKPLNSVAVHIKTTYPFGDDTQVHIKNDQQTPVIVQFRVPTWSKLFQLNRSTIYSTIASRIVPAGKQETFSIQMNPEIYIEKWDNNSVSIHHGPLLYALPIETNFTNVKHHFLQSNDYYVTPMSPWNYALDLSSLEYLSKCQYSKQMAPFNHTGWPGVITAKARRIHNWKLKGYSAEPPPASPYSCKVSGACGPREDIVLVPYGATDLRVGQFPYLEHEDQEDFESEK